jgi:hypothetical protein
VAPVAAEEEPAPVEELVVATPAEL